MKPGVRTSELYLSIAGMVAVTTMTVTGTADPESIAAITGLAGIYTAGRSWVKAREVDR